MKIGPSMQLPSVACINCNAELSGAACVAGDAYPRSGDITICIYCGHLMAYADDLSLRNLTSNEIHEIAGDERILAVYRARQRMDGAP